tara:strand:+ start:122420 stop:123817 length:1398 start_codon:yes stop_codon:yes gene_type:complete
MFLKQRFCSNLIGFVTGSYITRDACDQAFVRMHTRDRIGDRLHLLFACIAMVGIGGPVSMVDIAVLPLAVFFLVRVFNTFPVWIHGFGQPVVLCGILLAGWMGVSLLWSSDPVAGLENMGELRWLAMIGFVFPVIEHRKLLIGCLCFGFFAGNVVQVIDAFNGFGNEWLAQQLWHYPERVSGWWDPAVGGSMLVAAVGLYLPIAFFGQGWTRARLFGVLGFLISITGLIATGTRGAWIAGIGLLIASGVIGIVVRRWSRKTVVVGSVIALVVVVIGGAVAWNVQGVSDRVNNAQEELALAMEGNYLTSMGVRVSLAGQAIGAGASHPLGGLGAGGFGDWMRERTPDQLDNHSHPHSSVLRLFAEQGIPGVLIGVLLVVVLLTASWRCVESDDRGTLLMGPFYAILGVVLVSAFDSVLLNANTSALIGALAALSPSYLPMRGSARRVGSDLESTRDSALNGKEHSR